MVQIGYTNLSNKFAQIWVLQYERKLYSDTNYNSWIKNLANNQIYASCYKVT